MLLTSLGLTVLNKIPTQAITGLLSGKLQIAGGVIRWAAGTARGGQIFMHLLPAGGSSLLNLVPGLNFLPGLVANFQLHGISGKIDTLQQMTQLNTHHLMQISRKVGSLTQTSQNILQLATGTAILSGLSLGVSSIGFIAVNKKLNIIDTRLTEIQKDVQAIREFLERSERARLFTALEDVLKVNTTTNQKHKDRMLHTARTTFAEINHKYGELLMTSNSINAAMANEEYFSLTALAQVRCSAELGMFEVARQEMEAKNTFWRKQARRIANDLLLGDYPERFLASDFAQDVPISALVSWLDFSHDENKGYEWIDELRQNINEPWYTPKRIWKKSGKGLNQNIGIGLQKEQEITIPTLQKLIARHNIFEGYCAQYEIFEKQKLRPSEFQENLSQIPKQAAIEGYYLLQPIKKTA